MPDSHRVIPHSLVYLLVVVVAVGLMAGTSRLVVPQMVSYGASPLATRMSAATLVTSTQDLSDSAPLTTSKLPPGLVATDTTGIIIGASVLIVIIGVGVFLGTGVKVPFNFHFRRKNK